MKIFFTIIVGDDVAGIAFGSRHTLSQISHDAAPGCIIFLLGKTGHALMNSCLVHNYDNMCQYHVPAIGRFTLHSDSSVFVAMGIVAK